MVEKLETIPKLARTPRPAFQGDLRVRRQIPNAGRGRWGADTQPVGRPFPDPPPGWQDGAAHWAVFWSHRRLGRGPEGEGLWWYRTPFGGHIGILGFVPDFLETDLSIAIDVVDLGQVGADYRAIATLRAAALRGVGLTYIVITADQALTNPVAALRLALAGVPNATVQ